MLRVPTLSDACARLKKRVILSEAKSLKRNTGSEHNEDGSELFRFSQHDSAICKMSSKS
jgi:hypothetical protein